MNNCVKCRFMNTTLQAVDYVNEENIDKSIKILKEIPRKCDMHKQSQTNQNIRDSDQNKKHPIQVKRGQIYNTIVGENIGAEVCNNHLVLIIQNDMGNKHADTVNVLTIKGDGNNINPKFHVKLTNVDMFYGSLDKDPSRINTTEILTIDKSRLNTRIGKIDNNKFKEINYRIKRQLGLQ